MLLEILDLPIMFFIEDFINSLYGKVYNIEMFFLNNILIFIYFLIHFRRVGGKMNELSKRDKVYKKYKGIISLHIITTYIITISLCSWLVSLKYYEVDIYWNVFLAPFMSISVSTFISELIYTDIEVKLIRTMDEKRYSDKYKELLTMIISAQELQQKILDNHNSELEELKKNISIVDEMMKPKK